MVLQNHLNAYCAGFVLFVKTLFKGAVSLKPHPKHLTLIAWGIRLQATIFIQNDTQKHCQNSKIVRKYRQRAASLQKKKHHSVPLNSLN